MLSGYKTFIIAAIGIIYGLVHGDMQIVEQSLLAITLRLGISGK